MALATRCPNCQALFRVAPDQLKLRGGLVRCGACGQVFDAIGTLSYIDDAALATSPPAVQPTVGAVIAAIRKAESTVGGAMGPTDTPPAAVSSMTEPPAGEAHVIVPFEDEAVVEFDGRVEVPSPPATEPIEPAEEAIAIAPSDAEVPAETETAPAPEPAAGEIERNDTPPVVEPLPLPASAAATEPSFLRQTEAPKPSRRPLFIAAAILLAVLALAQLAVTFRAEIVTALPQTRPALGQLCRLFGCTVSWPARPELLAVVGTELQALPGTNLFELTAVVRNRGQITMELPAIELTLSDTLDRIVVRKVFAPADYLAGSGNAGSQIEAGLAAGADLTVRIAFEARDINAAGFVVYPFYL